MPSKEVGISRFYKLKFNASAQKIKLQSIVIYQKISDINYITVFAHIFHQFFPSLISDFSICHFESVPSVIYIKSLVEKFQLSYIVQFNIIKEPYFCRLTVFSLHEEFLADSVKKLHFSIPTNIYIFFADVESENRSLHFLYL